MSFEDKARFKSSKAFLYLKSDICLFSISTILSCRKRGAGKLPVRSKCHSYLLLQTYIAERFSKLLSSPFDLEKYLNVAYMYL